MNIYEFESVNPRGVVVTHRASANTPSEALEIVSEGWNIKTNPIYLARVTTTYSSALAKEKPVCGIVDPQTGQLI